MSLAAGTATSKLSAWKTRRARLPMDTLAINEVYEQLVAAKGTTVSASLIPSSRNTRSRPIGLLSRGRCELHAAVRVQRGRAPRHQGVRSLYASIDAVVPYASARKRMSQDRWRGSAHVRLPFASISFYSCKYILLTMRCSQRTGRQSFPSHGERVPGACLECHPHRSVLPSRGSEPGTFPAAETSQISNTVAVWC